MKLGDLIFILEKKEVPAASYYLPNLAIVYCMTRPSRRAQHDNQ